MQGLTAFLQAPAAHSGSAALRALRSVCSLTLRLRAAGIDPERLASYDRPIRSPPPTFSSQQVQGLTEDLIAYRCAAAVVVAFSCADETHEHAGHFCMHSISCRICHSAARLLNQGNMGALTCGGCS